MARRAPTLTGKAKPAVSPPEVELVAARRFAQLATGLGAAWAGVPEALAYLGYVQLDPLNVCGRMHDLILRNRVRDYREGQLLAEVHASVRCGFEHYLPGAGVLVAFPWEAWPYLQAAMRERRRSARGYGGRLTRAEEQVAQQILGELAARGPQTSDDFAHAGRGVSAWGTRGRIAKIVLEKLFFHGRVLIAGRREFRRIYALPEQVLPVAVRDQPEASAEATARWLIELRLRQRRLVSLKPREQALVADFVQPVCVAPGLTLYHLRSDAGWWEHAGQPGTGPVRLLAPLDPLIYDRRVTRALWGFDYTWEVYTPALKRVRGYYTLPVLASDALVGHVEPRVDRLAGRLTVLGRRVPRGFATQPAVAELARFLGAL